jgi:hypothetical protein
LEFVGLAAWATKKKIRRQQVRQQRAKISRTRWSLLRSVVSWTAISGTLFVLAATAIALLGAETLKYSVGQRVDQPIYARVDFQVPDEKKTADDKEAARASTPSYYSPSASSLTFDRIRADLMRVYQAAHDAETLEEFEKSLDDLGWPHDARGYERLRGLADDAGRAQFQGWVDQLPLEKEYVVRDLLHEPREPSSALDFVRLEIPDESGQAVTVEIPHAELIPHGNEKALHGSASSIARKFRLRELMPAVEAIVFAAFHERPTIVFNQERNVQAMREAEDATPPAMRSFDKGKPFVTPGVIGSEQYTLLQAHHAAYWFYLVQGTPEAAAERTTWRLRWAGTVSLIVILAVGLLIYVKLHHPRIFEVRSRTIAFYGLILACLLVARLLELRWSQFPELAFAPCLIAANVLAIAYPRRLAVGASCIVAVIVTTLIGESVAFLLTLFVGVAVAGHQLEEIRKRTKLIGAGMTTAIAIMVVAAAGGLVQGHAIEYIQQHALRAGGCAIGAAFVVSGLLPFIERMFRMATSLTLLEWRDPTSPLLQLLAREAPGTYNHSLVVGTLAEVACTRIGANGLLAQVGALYHDIGKIQKPDYFTENQEGRISRHENLAPTMSLLIILGHVKDGVEMAKEYKIPRVLLQFIEEHHGTTVVRYFHQMASDKQPGIASGKHDREVSEAEFRYSGPKPRTRETAILMLCDGVEGAVRALPEATPGRIESVVHQILNDRLNDGQFDDCDITLKEIHLVEESLVKSLCSIYHGRVAYPKAAKAAVEAEARPERMSV